jgi:hypothetical protein
MNDHVKQREEYVVDYCTIAVHGPRTRVVAQSYLWIPCQCNIRKRAYGNRRYLVGIMEFWRDQNYLLRQGWSIRCACGLAMF